MEKIEVVASCNSLTDLLGKSGAFLEKGHKAMPMLPDSLLANSLMFIN